MAPYKVFQALGIDPPKGFFEIADLRGRSPIAVAATTNRNSKIFSGIESLQLVPELSIYGDYFMIIPEEKYSRLRHIFGNGYGYIENKQPDRISESNILRAIKILESWWRLSIYDIVKSSDFRDIDLLPSQKNLIASIPLEQLSNALRDFIRQHRLSPSYASLLKLSLFYAIPLKSRQHIDFVPNATDVVNIAPFESRILIFSRLQESLGVFKTEEIIDKWKVFPSSLLTTMLAYSHTINKDQLNFRLALKIISGPCQARELAIFGEALSNKQFAERNPQAIKAIWNALKLLEQRNQKVFMELFTIFVVSCEIGTNPNVMDIVGIACQRPFTVSKSLWIYRLLLYDDVSPTSLNNIMQTIQSFPFDSIMSLFATLNFAMDVVGYDLNIRTSGPLLKLNGFVDSILTSILKTQAAYAKLQFFMKGNFDNLTSLWLKCNQQWIVAEELSNNVGTIAIQKIKNFKVLCSILNNIPLNRMRMNGLAKYSYDVPLYQEIVYIFLNQNSIVKPTDSPYIKAIELPTSFINHDDLHLITLSKALVNLVYKIPFWATDKDDIKAFGSKGLATKHQIVRRRIETWVNLWMSLTNRSYPHITFRISLVE